jgi:hypothetical protein
MMTPDPILCYRCGQPGRCGWIDVTSLGEVPGSRVLPGEQYCLTPGCVDEDGSRRLVALTVEELRRRADEAFMARHERLVKER